MKPQGHRSGQIAVVLTLAIATLLGVISLGTDVGVMYYNWVQLQKAADAAAIAGANYLSENLTGESLATASVNSNCTNEPDDAQKAACTYAVSNGLATDANSMKLNENVAGMSNPNIQVIATRSNLPYLFGRIIGLSTYSVAAVATATQGSTAATNGMVPMGVQCTAPCSLINLNPGAPVSFGVKFTPVFSATGNWQWLANGPGANGVGNAITNGMPGVYAIGDTITTKPGSDSQGPVVAAFNSRFSSSSCTALSPDPCSGGGNPNNIPGNDPCLVTVPAVDFSGTTGSKPLIIEAFAQVYIEPGSTIGGKSGNSITSCFVKQLDPNAVASGGPALGSLGRPVLIQ